VNSRLDTLQAAILLPKLAVLDEELKARQQVAETYSRLLFPVIANEAWQAMSSITTPYLEPHNTSAWAQYTVQVPNREAMQEQLKQAGIPTAVHYPIPLNKQPAVADASVQLPVGDAVAQRVISLPIGSTLSSADQERIVQTLLRRKA
jgi:UDP-2-acetamido-2-deoxy-ribo-hexuluronate aminotransferase